MWSLEHFNHYIKGSHAVFQTNHKPLVSISNNTSPRIQRLLFRMSRYSVTLEYNKGNTNIIADALSRNTIPAIHTNVPLEEDISIDEVLCPTFRISTTGIQLIRDEPIKDSTPQKLT